MKCRHWFPVLLLMSSALFNSAECLKYEPSQVSLCGKIARLTYAGRPNYESVKAGDEAETYWYLILDAPICVMGTEGDVLNVNEANIKEIQLVLNEKQYKEYKGMVLKQARVSGALFHAISAHHHLTILMNVKEIKTVA